MKILNTLKNKYFITISFIIVWLFFFDKNDVFTQRELIKKCEKLQKEKEYYLSEIKSNTFFLNELHTNKKSLETFARETYLMKKQNEDIYVFVLFFH